MNLFKSAFVKAAVVAMGFGLVTSACAAEEMTLKGNVQTQVTKSIADEDNNFSSGWIRANVGGQYKSDNLDGLIMLRIFAPEFGNKIKDGDGKTTAYDKILADLYWANYKWNLGSNNMLNLKLGRWKTDWSQSTNFGTYIDKDLTKRGLWMRDYSHNAVELGWKNGLNQLNAMVAAKNGTANQGYVRVEDDLKFTFPLDMKFAYRANLIDVVQNTAAVTHRVAAYASYTFMPNLRLYGEYACIYTEDEDINTSAKNYIAPESKYFTQGDYVQPFYVGLEVPTFGILSNLMFEMEYIKDRQDVIHKTPNNEMDDLAWTVALVKSVGKSKLQFSLYSEDEMTDLGMAFRLTTTFK
ncbi:MAG: hypothetical protein MJZ26_10305 [Fibrobacter sp.]|nr:hypothetical protein [Fibrobacter sp.]